MASAYFVTIGEKRSGPYDHSELRRQLLSQELSTDDLAWTEGMDSWIAIRDIEELREVVRSVPPRLEKSHQVVNKPVTKKSKRAANWSMAIMALVLTAVAVWYYVNNNASGRFTDASYLGVQQSKLPDPVVVEKQGKGTFHGLEYYAVVGGTIRNKGKSGYLRVVAEVTQRGKSATRTKDIFLDEEEQKSIEFELEEVDEGEWTYRFWGTPLAK